MTSIKSSILKYLPKSLKSRLKVLIEYVKHCLDFDPFMGRTYAHEGEDVILERLFVKQKKGFYIDVGAHHPRRFSNTFVFYKLGWNGINIDAMPKSMKPFCKERPRDINLEIPIAKQQKTMIYFQFNEPALNTFSEEIALSKDGDGSFRVISKQSIEAYPLSLILEKHVPRDQKIDFLSVDVEGLDMEVLESNDWNKYRPKVVLIEIINSSLDLIIGSPAYQFLTEHNYRLYAKGINTIYFISNEFQPEV